MKRRLFKTFVALLAIAAAATGPAWGQNANPDVTLDFTDNTSWGFPEGKTNKTYAANSYTSGDYTITLQGGGSSNGYYFNSGYLLLGKTDAYLELPEFSSPVEKIEVVGPSGASGQVVQNIYVGETAVSTQTTGATGTNTYVINENYRAAGNIYTLKVGSAHNTQITYIKVYYVSSGGGSTPEPQTVQLTLASNNSAMGYATVALHPEYELYDTYYPTTSSSQDGTKTSMWTYASVTDGAWINTSTESNSSFSVNPNYGITIHHVTFYNANNQSVEVEPNEGNSVYVQLKNGNVYKDYDGTQLLLSGGITRVEAYGMEMSLPAGVTATATAGVYDVVPGTQVPVAAVAKRHYQLNNWSNNATTDTVTVTVNAAMTLTANFVASPVLTLVANNAQMGRVEIPRHQGNGFLCEFKAADYAGQQSLSGMHEKFYFNTVPVAANSTVWTNNEDYSNDMSVNPEGFKNERYQCRVVFVGPNGETYEFDFSNNNNNHFADVYLKSGNTYSDYSCNNLLWEGGVASIECYGPGLILPDGVDQITDNTYSVLAGTEVPVEATAKLRYHFVNWSNNSTEAQTTYTMPATAATLTANFVANPTLTLTATPAHGGSVGFDFTPTPQTLTVNDGTVTNGAVPINPCYLDNNNTRGQHIIPAEQLGLMAGATLNSITWYVNDESSWSSTSNVNVYLKEVDNTTLTEFVNSDTTLVYTGTLSYADGQMTVTFSRPYTYQGGNLLVGVDNPTAGNYTCRDFFGVEAPAGSSADAHGYYTAYGFLPKSTFNYTPTLPDGVIANTDGTYSVAAGTQFTLKANAADDYTLGSWSNQAEVNANATQTLTMPATDLTIGATFVGQPYTVRMAAGTEEAANWSIASGDASVPGTQVLENVMSGSQVTATYNGTTKKVKSVKAVKYVPPAATVTTAPTATGATIAANSTAALVNAGAAIGGTMMYAVTATNVQPASTAGFSASIPTAEGRTVGTYYVWYYVKADDSHTDSEIAGPVSVTLEVMTTVTWNSSNVFNSAHENDMIINSEWNSGSLTYEGVTISISGEEVSSFEAYNEHDQAGNLTCFGDEGDSFTFTAPSGKKFCKIEIIDDWGATFTNYGDWRQINNNIVWSGTAANAVTLGTVFTSASYLNSIVFTLIDAQ